jgi:hypothetical protein
MVEVGRVGSGPEGRRRVDPPRPGRRKPGPVPRVVLEAVEVEVEVAAAVAVAAK